MLLVTTAATVSLQGIAGHHSSPGRCSCNGNTRSRRSQSLHADSAGPTDSISVYHTSKCSRCSETDIISTDMTEFGRSCGHSSARAPAKWLEVVRLTASTCQTHGFGNAIAHQRPFRLPVYRTCWAFAYNTAAPDALACSCVSNHGRTCPTAPTRCHLSGTAPHWRCGRPRKLFATECALVRCHSTDHGASAQRLPGQRSRTAGCSASPAGRRSTTPSTCTPASITAPHSLPVRLVLLLCCAAFSIW